MSSRKNDVGDCGDISDDDDEKEEEEMEEEKITSVCCNTWGLGDSCS